MSEFRILFLDKRNQIIADEVQQKGTVDHTPVYVREVVKRALELSATAIVLVHNHPSGDPTPSRADIEMTKQIVSSAKNLGIVVHDHIIVGKQGHASFRGIRIDLVRLRLSRGLRLGWGLGYGLRLRRGRRLSIGFGFILLLVLGLFLALALAFRLVGLARRRCPVDGAFRRLRSAGELPRIGAVATLKHRRPVAIGIAEAGSLPHILQLVHASLRRASL